MEQLSLLRQPILLLHLHLNEPRQNHVYPLERGPDILPPLHEMRNAIERHALVFQNIEFGQEGDDRLLRSEEIGGLFPHVRVLEEVLKKGFLQLGNLEDFDLGHGLEPLDHPTLVWDRIEKLDGVYGHDSNVWEPTGEVFDEWTVVVADHVENRQVDRVLGGEGIEDVNSIQHGEVPDDEGSKAGEVNGREADIDEVLDNPPWTGSIQREFAQPRAPLEHVAKNVDRGTILDRHPSHIQHVQIGHL